jgi:GH15 family glucan-1,4-alpha-glucosidase
MVTDLYHHSIDVILKNQHKSGAYIASPNFETYNYCWFRDGSYIAYAMDLVGENQSAELYHQWAARVINQRAGVVRQAIEKASRNEPLGENEILHTRYGVDGSEDEGDWPNFQLDGFGTWLWALHEHKQFSSQPISAGIMQAARLVADYLSALWRLPCYDCWEEFPNQVHLYTLGAIHAGLSAESNLNNNDHEQVLDQIKDYIFAEGARRGYFPKFIGSEKVDASLLGLAVPYRVLDLNHPVVMATKSKIESDLQSGGGLHRYDSDTYYGGGEWLLLTAWLAWVYLEMDQIPKARLLLDWVTEQADLHGNLPEQVPQNLYDPSQYQPWLERWGQIAKPLLWSHAKYLIVAHILRNQNSS